MAKLQNISNKMELKKSEGPTGKDGKDLGKIFDMIAEDFKGAEEGTLRMNDQQSGISCYSKGLQTFCTRRTIIKGIALSGVVAASPALIAGCANFAVSEVPLKEKIAQMLMVGFRGLALDQGNYIFRDIHEHRIGGVILFDRDACLKTDGRNIVSPEQLRRLTDSLRTLSSTPLFIAVDQEGGKVARLKESCGFPPTVSAQFLGDRNDPAITRRYADRIASTLAENGFNMNFAPVVDLNINPQSPAIGSRERSFSANPDIVTSNARIFVEAHDNKNVATCFKHFPGHGSATVDSHLGFVDITNTWSQIELEPYRNLIKEGNCRMVMTAHVFNRHIDPDLPATLSKPFITGILRKQLGYNGVVVSDDLQMKGLTRFFDYKTILEKSILAGVDIMLVSNNLNYDPEITPTTINHVMELVRAGRITEKRIDESYQRIMAMKNRLSASGHKKY